MLPYILGENLSAGTNFIFTHSKAVGQLVKVRQTHCVPLLTAYKLCALNFQLIFTTGQISWSRTEVLCENSYNVYQRGVQVSISCNNVCVNQLS